MALVQSAVANSSTNVTSRTPTLGSNPSAGNFLIVTLAYGSNGTITAPAGWKLAASKANGSTLQTAIYYLENCGTTAAYQFNFGTSGSVACTIAEYSGVSGNLTLDQSNNNSGASTTFDSGTTSTAHFANELYIASLGYINATALTLSAITGGFASQRISDATGGTNIAHNQLLDLSATSAGTADAGETLSSSATWAGCIAGFKLASQVTALTVYPVTTASSTLATANKLVNTTGGSNTSRTSKVGTSTGYGELYAQGTTNAWAAAGSLPSPSGNGFLYDVTTLELQSIVAGNWTPTIKLSISAGTATADIICVASKRSSGGVYTAIGTFTLSAQSLSTVSATYNFAASAQSAVSFATGDKLYIGYFLNITANSSGSSSATVSFAEASSSTSGSVSAQVVTPGYEGIEAISDSASGTTNAPTFATITESASDAGTGTDSEASKISFTNTNSASGTDSEASKISFTNTDARTGSQSVALGTVGVAKTDSGTGATSQADTTTFARTDSATGANSESATISAPVSTSGTGSQSLGFGTVGVATSNTGTGATSQADTTTFARTDSATGATTEAAPVTTNIASSGTGATSEVTSATQSLSNSATGATSENTGITLGQVPNVGTGSQSFALGTIKPSATDSASGHDGYSQATVAESIASAGTGASALATVIAVQANTAGSESDAIALGTIHPSATDSASGHQNYSQAVVVIALHENGSGTDTQFTEHPVTISDHAVGVDITVLAMYFHGPQPTSTNRDQPLLAEVG